MVRQSRLDADKPCTPIPVLLTRPEGPARRFAGQLGDRFGPAVLPVITPLMQVQFIAPDWPDVRPVGQPSALILTSEAGAAAAGDLVAAGADLPGFAFCVGERTAQAAREAGFAAIAGWGDADHLVDLILDHALTQPVTGPLWHLCGFDRRGDVADRLTRAGIATQAITVYRQDPQPLTAQAQAVLAKADPVIVPLFSPRSAQLFAEAVRALGAGCAAPLWLAPISAAAAEAALDLHPARLEIAERPDAGSMLDAVARLMGDCLLT